MPKDDTVSVRVALRIRPMLSHETSIGCQTCISEVPDEPQVVAGGKEFTYDYVFGSNTGQSPIFDNCVSPLLDKFFAGYNCTILAYGQTGAGKTHTMGTADTCPNSDHNKSGVIPRIIHELFSRISDNTETTYKLKATYLEILKEEVKDLLTGTICQNAIRENHDGSIVIQGLSEQYIDSSNALYSCLKTGAENRAVAGHALNAQSSRSHAVFALILEQQQKNCDSYLISKFNLVDLAGSERAKRTKAEGERLKEGININRGLLALGNVISALGDPDGKSAHVPYRNSKITRLLQDSLGGNSMTLMIACCSPADSNLEETVNTLRYADRARKIKNKAVINRDPRVAELIQLRKENAELKASIIDNGSNVDVTELNELRQRVESLKNENEALISQLRGSEHSTTEKLTKLAELLTVTQIQRDMLRDKMTELQDSGIISADITLESPALESSLSETSDVIDAEEALSADTKRREIGEKLQALSQQLNSHEEYAKSLQQNDGTFNILREQYQNNVASLNNEIDDLNSQKSDLENKIKILEKGPRNKKQIEQKSAALSNLLDQISDLKRKCSENERLLKIKKGNDTELSKLTTEIKSMKKQRVDLLKNMRTENKKFQQFKNAKNKEVVQMKRFEEKKRAELHKQAAAQQRSANVMKRRYEEAQTMNKRLKETMDKQQKALAKRVGPGKSLDVKGLLKGHINMKITREMAREAIEMFIEQRKKLHGSLQTLKKLPKSDKVTEDIDDVEKQINFKSQQISNLQSEIFKSEQRMKNDVFKQLNSIGDCKTGLKWLCETAIENHLRENGLKRELEVEDSEKGKLQDEIAALELNFEDFKKQSDEKEMELRKEFQLSVRSLEVQNRRLKSLRTNQPAGVKAQQAFRRQFVRKDSLGSMTEESDSENAALESDDSWFEENKEIIQDMENVGLKTPKSIKKAIRRRTVRVEKGGCKCKGNCGSKQCGCAKLDGSCGPLCKCNVERCKNRPTDKDPDLEISLHMCPKKNLLSTILDDTDSESDESDKENMDDELLLLKRKSSGEKSDTKRLKTRKS